MNAIILAAGKSSRMYQTGANIHKALLPIQNIPNIERIILMLHCFGITEIIVAVPHNCLLFEYLEKRYTCKIIHVEEGTKNTLHTIKHLLPYINDTFIIEGDVVLAKNIFETFKYSTYYVMKYPNPEEDDWHPIMNKDGNISSFEVSQRKTIAIFGISYWSKQDCPLLISHLSQQCGIYKAENPNIFWDDDIIELADKIPIKIYEISANTACEMNTYAEYQYAQTLCKSVVNNCFDFFDNVRLRTNEGISYKIFCGSDKRKNVHILNRLLYRHGGQIESGKNLNYEELFFPNELICILKTNSGQEIAFFSLVQHTNYLLLCRLYVEPDYRFKHLGTQIIHYIQLYSQFSSKELRVNIYNDNTEKFYTHSGFEKLSITCHLEPNLEREK